MDTKLNSAGAVLMAAAFLILALGCDTGDQPQPEGAQGTSGEQPAPPAGNQPQQQAAGSGAQLPQPDAEAVWQYLEQQNYDQWSFWPGTDGFYEGTRPHGAQLKTFVNPTAQEALTNDPSSLPTGSMIVKENYSPDQEMMSVTVMYKTEGYNPEHNDWFWLKRLADGTVEASGQVEGCQSCHQASETDYLMTELP